MAPIHITDDDPDARFIVAEILKTNGYNVLAAGGGAEVPQRLRVPLALPKGLGNRAWRSTTRNTYPRTDAHTTKVTGVPVILDGGVVVPPTP